MTTLARRQKTKWIKRMKANGYRWFMGRLWHFYQYRASVMTFSRISNPTDWDIQLFNFQEEALRGIENQ